MAQIEIRKAQRYKAKLRLAIAGPSGGGKTMGALKLAKGLGGRVCLIDTERGSGDLYADLYEYDIISLEPPFKPDILIEALRAAEAADYDVIVVDSLSHFWADEGGLLDQADKMQSAGKNRFTLWADITPQHRRLVNSLLNSPKHIVATMRSKQEYAMETDDKGKASVKKLGLAPVQREGMEYEFTVFFDVDQNHNAKASKDRTNMFNNEHFIIDESIGQRISKWLESGTEDPKKLKREAVEHLRRLEMPIPTDPVDAAEFVRKSLSKITGIEYSEANLPAIVKAIHDVQDPKAAYKLVFEEAAPNAPQAPQSDDGSKRSAEVEGDAPAAPAAKSKGENRSKDPVEELGKVLESGDGRK